MVTRWSQKHYINTAMPLDYYTYKSKIESVEIGYPERVYKKKFAYWPQRCSNNYIVWLDYYYVKLEQLYSPPLGLSNWVVTNPLCKYNKYEYAKLILSDKL